MVSVRIPHLLLVLFFAASPTGLLADDCLSSSVNSVGLSASSYRNKTGHWVTKALLTRSSTRDVRKLQTEDQLFHYDIGITRQVCDDVETVTTAFTVVGKEPPARVGADYEFFPDVGFYKLHKEKKNWENARRTCEKERAHLAIINSEAEENAIRKLMKNYSTGNAFIGFHDMFKEGDYVTIYGDPLNSTGRIRWAKGQPDNFVYSESPEGEDCGDILSDGTINDSKCSLEIPFVCEMEL